MDAYLADVSQVVPTQFEGDADESVSALFMYSKDDPFAVVARFMTVDSEVDWTFSRDLLAEGLEHPVGEGDVRVAPLGTGQTTMELVSPVGAASLICDTTVVRAFLDQTFAAVAQGEEWRLSDMDAWLAEIAQ